MKTKCPRHPLATEKAGPMGMPRATEEELSRFESEGGSTGLDTDRVARRAVLVPRETEARDRPRRRELLPRGADHRGRILLVYAVAQRHARVIADALAARLRSHGFAVEIGDASAGMMPPPQDYDAVVLGSVVGFGRQNRLIETYIEQNHVALAEVPTALFTVSNAGTIRDRDPGGLLGQLSLAVDWQPDLAATFPSGAIPRDGLTVRLAKWIGCQKAPRDDAARHTIGTDVEHFADTIAAELAGAAQTAERTEPHRDDASVVHLGS